MAYLLMYCFCHDVWPPCRIVVDERDIWAFCLPLFNFNCDATVTGLPTAVTARCQLLFITDAFMFTDDGCCCYYACCEPDARCRDYLFNLTIVLLAIGRVLLLILGTVDAADLMNLPWYPIITVFDGVHYCRAVPWHSDVRFSDI